jgi:hypothetical protein
MSTHTVHGGHLGHSVGHIASGGQKIIEDPRAHPLAKGTAVVAVTGAVGVGVAALCGVAIGWPVVLGLAGLSWAAEALDKKLR